MRRSVVALLATIGLLVSLAACGGDSPATGQESEARSRTSNYNRLVAAQPAHKMDYSPTREGINFWSDTWDTEGKLSYVYLMASNGQLVGYYIFKGLPISYCASLYPTYEFLDAEGDGDDYRDNWKVEAPSLDGVYYSGGQCTQYFGKDASTGTYLEFSAGQGINFLVYEEPLPRQDVEPLGFATIKESK